MIRDKRKEGSSRPRVVLVEASARRPSLGHRIADEVADEVARHGAELRRQDLLGDRFDPVLRLDRGETYPTLDSPNRDPITDRYREDVRGGDVFVIVHPVWWFAPPAILKGWIDKLLIHEVAIEQRTPGPPRPLLSGRSACVIQTFKATFENDVELMGRMSERFWRTGVFPSVGIDDVRRLALYRVEDLEPERLDAFLARVRRVVGGLLETQACPQRARERERGRLRQR